MLLVLGMLAVLVVKVLYFGLGFRNGRREDWKARSRSKQAGVAGMYEVILQPAETKPELKKVVVTGASSYLGRSVVRQLASRSKGKLQVVAFDWQLTPQELPDLDVAFIQGDVSNKSHLAELLRGCSCVVHLSTSSRGSGQGPEQHLLVSFQATQRLIEVCLDLDVPYLLYSSSTSTITHPRAVQQCLTDTSPYPSTFASPAAETRACAEQLVRAANSHVLHTLVLRVSHTFGLADQGLADAAMGSGIIGQARSNVVPVVWVEDAGRAHALAVEKMLLADPGSETGACSTWGQALNISSDPDDSPCFKELVGQASPTTASPGTGTGASSRCSVWGGALQRSRVPVWVLEVLAAWGEGLQGLSGAEQGFVMSRATIHQWFKQSVRVGIDGAQQQLQWQPTPWRDAVERIKQQQMQGKKRAKRE